MRTTVHFIMTAFCTLPLVAAGPVMSTEPADYAAAIERLNQAVREQMDKHGIRGIALALVDDQRTVHAAGFGTANRDSIFRAGSISKLFNAVAIMQLVEQGKLDLDAPIERHGRQFSTLAPFADAPPVTLRMLLCHRSGMVRESPVGGYLDDSQPALADMVASVRSCPLINPPNTKTRYSNVGPSVAGQILATAAGVPYAEYQRKHLLEPLGMASSSFLLAGIPRERLSPAWMRIADARGRFASGAAPVFDLGTLPAGNLYTTAEDLAKFVSMLAANGQARGRQIISGQTLALMGTPQLIETETGFGLGFMAGKFRGHKSLGHMGAVYGYTSSLVFLPGPKIGVVLLCNEDILTGPVAKLTNAALGLMLEAKCGEKPLAAPAPIQLAPEELAAMAGEYESPSHWARIEAAGNGLCGNISGQPIALTAVGPLKFLADGRVQDSAPVEFQRDASGTIAGFTALNQTFTRVDPARLPAVPPSWNDFVGSYGPAFIPLVVSIRHGHLYAMIENEFDYRLIPSSRNVFVCPPGMYREEHLVFLTGPQGRVHGAQIANMYLRRWEATAEPASR